MTAAGGRVRPREGADRGRLARFLLALPAYFALFMRRLFPEGLMKSTVDEIRRRFDADVERFSDLETGQSATVDAPLAMALVARAAAATTPHARHVLDVGCGAGNYSL